MLINQRKEHKKKSTNSDLGISFYPTQPYSSSNCDWYKVWDESVFPVADTNAGVIMLSPSICTGKERYICNGCFYYNSVTHMFFVPHIHQK
jgi:hypothetical protein